MVPSRNRTHRLLVLILAGAASAAAWAPGVPARASDRLGVVLSDVADQVAGVLRGQGQDEVVVGDFVGPPNLQTSSGPGLEKGLSEELEKRGIAVKRKADLGLKGEFHLASLPSEARPGEKEMAIKLKVSVVDTFGEPVGDADREWTITGEEAIIHIIGASVVLPPQATPKEREATLRRGIILGIQSESTDDGPALGIRAEASADGPAVGVQAEVASRGPLRAGPGSPYGLEVLVDGEPRPARIEDGQAMVRIEQGEQYTLRLINDSPLEAAARVTIDGLSIYAFSEMKHTSGSLAGRPLYDFVIIPPESDASIKGWHRNNRESDAFLVTEYARSASATLENRARVGTITVSFAAAWPEGTTPPSDEAPTQRSEGNATGFGPRVQAKFAEVRRVLGVVRASISVRYAKEGADAQ